MKDDVEENSEDLSSEERDEKKLLSSYRAEIKHYKKRTNAWRSQCERITRKYLSVKDCSGAEESFKASSLNIYLSTLQTLQPSTYSRTPKPIVERRWKDQDIVGRAAAQLLERSTTFAVANYHFDDVMRSVRDDFLKYSRGQAWVRYVSKITARKKRQVLVQEATEDSEEMSFRLGETEEEYQGEVEFEEDGQAYGYAEEESVEYECIKFDYIHRDDFGHSEAACWEEVDKVWKRVWMTREELKSRFGEEESKAIPLTQKKSDEEDSSGQGEEGSFAHYAEVYELWDKTKKEVYWFASGYDRFLDVQEDPLGLEQFFPCPRPMFGMLEDASLIPIPDVLHWERLVDELNELTDRILALQKMIKVIGVHNSAFPEVESIFSEYFENTSVPVPNFSSWAQSGGFRGNMEFAPIDQYAGVLLQLYQAREQTKQAIYEATGMSDIIRGASNPNETATAQQIKGQFSTLRLQDRQQEVQRFARDLIAIGAEIIAEHFEPETMRLMAGTDFLAELDPNMGLSFEQAVMLLRDDKLRSFRVSIETDSTIAIAEQMDRQDRVEFIQMAGQFLQQGLGAAQGNPIIAPMLFEMIKFGVRGFRSGRQLETAIEQALLAVNQQMQQPPPPPQPDPKMVEIQGKQQLAQMDMQFQQAKAQAEFNFKQTELQMKMQKDMQELALKQEQMRQELGLKSESIRQDMALKAYQADQRATLETKKAIGKDLAKKKKIYFFTDPTNPAVRIGEAVDELGGTTRATVKYNEQGQAEADVEYF
jgi:hypothetical protein